MADEAVGTAVTVDEAVRTRRVLVLVVLVCVDSWAPRQ